MNIPFNFTQRAPEPVEPPASEADPSNDEDRTAQPETGSALGRHKMRRAATGRRGWFGGDESQSIAFYGEYYR